MYIDFETVRKVVRLAHDPRRSSLRQATVMDTLLSIWGTVNGVNWIGEKIDDLIHADYHDTPLGKPVYIVAAPRSGTTFLHRLMSLDPQFTALRMYETIFHSISTRRAVERMGRANGLVRKTLDAVIDKIDERSFGAWEGMHDTGITQHEEDEALWALPMATPALWLVLPQPEALAELRFVDTMPEHKQRQLVEHYRGAIQRHLYLNPGKTLLGKNVFLPGRFKIVRRALPEARFIHIIRHPYEALGSMLSLFTMPWEYTSPGVSQSGPEARALAELMIDYYRYLHEEDLRSRQAGEHSFVTVRYRDLLADPEKRVREIYEALEIDLSHEFETALHEAAREQRYFRSNHTYSLQQFGLSEDYIYEALPEIFEHYGFER